MRPLPSLLTSAPILLAFAVAPLAFAQDSPAKPLPDEFRVLVKEIEEAYKAPFEVDKDVLDELRKQYREVTAEREVKIFREIRRVFAPTPAQEESILRELRRAYEQLTIEQEGRLFDAIHRADRLPPGTVPVEVQADRAVKTFRKFDRNQDGVLASDELSENLRGQLGTWDRDRNGTIDPTEYLGYFQAGLQSVAERVASGEIPINLPKGAGPMPSTGDTGVRPSMSESPKATPATAPAAAASLPDWFAKLDADADGQVGLYEWKQAGRAIPDFLRMDANHDGFLAAKELLAYLAQHPAESGESRKRR